MFSPPWECGPSLGIEAKIQKMKGCRRIGERERGK
jgi:hypothetical protein